MKIESLKKWQDPFMPEAIDYEEGCLLYGLILARRPKVVIETGIGYSTLFILAALDEIGEGKLFSVDSYIPQIDKTTDVIHKVGFDAEHIIKNEDVVSWLEGKKRKVVLDTGFVDFAWIDDCHDYFHVLNVFHWLCPILNGDAIIAAHDSFCDAGGGRAYKKAARDHGLSLIRIRTPRGFDIFSTHNHHVF